MTPTERETKMAQLLEVMRELRRHHTHACPDCIDAWSHTWAGCGYPLDFPCPHHQWDDYPQSYGPKVPEEME